MTIEQYLALELQAYRLDCVCSAHSDDAWHYSGMARAKLSDADKATLDERDNGLAVSHYWRISVK